jgi:hypothetical protein
MHAAALLRDVARPRRLDVVDLVVVEEADGDQMLGPQTLAVLAEVMSVERVGSSEMGTT